MSKAFTKEDDNAHDEGIQRVDELPLTARNYVTPRGFELLTEEVSRLTTTEKPEVVRQLNEAAAASLELEVQPLKRRLRELDGRIHYLTQRLKMAEIVDPSKRTATGTATDQIFFGATVTFTNRRAETRTIRIVGVDEMDPAKGYITFVSPLAKALLRAHEGDTVPFQSPAGHDELEILEVRYQP
jgi:transcription elongation factor GreB